MHSPPADLQHQLNQCVRRINVSDPLDRASLELIKLIESISERVTKKEHDVKLLMSTRQRYIDGIEENKVSLEESYAQLNDHTARIKSREEGNKVLEDRLAAERARSQQVVDEIEEVEKKIQDIRSSQERQMELYKRLFGIELYNKDSEEVEIILTNVSPREEEAAITITCRKDPNALRIIAERCAPPLHSFDHLRDRVNSRQINWTIFVAALREIYRLQYGG